MNEHGGIDWESVILIVVIVVSFAVCVLTIVKPEWFERKK